MPRVAKELSALRVRSFKEKGMYPVGGVPGLYLQVVPPNSKTWILRITTGTNRSGKQRRQEIGLGNFDAVSLSEARETARAQRAKSVIGKDLVAEKRTEKRTSQLQTGTEFTFETAANALIAAKAPQWKSPVHYNQWVATLKTYAFPKIGPYSVKDIDTRHVYSILEPIWLEKTETAKRLRSRLEAVLDWASANGYREGANPARWKGHLDKMLPSPDRVAKKGKHPALPYRRINDFLIDLRRREATTAKALEFAIYTATRTNEVLNAVWDEIDFTSATWTIPRERMKSEEEHRVPLCSSAVSLLRSLPRIKNEQFVFVAPTGGAFSNTAMIALIKRMHDAQVAATGDGYTDPKQKNKVITTHGFRTTFRGWASEQGKYSREVLEKCLSHQIRNEVEAAYSREDLLSLRAPVMQDWDNYCQACTASTQS